MLRFKNCFLFLVIISFVLLLSSWDGKTNSVIGPLPPTPDYSDSTQWYMRERGGEADIFYIISTETGDHMMGNDTCHLANTYKKELRVRMLKEMAAVDSFYSGRLNYFSPYYRQVSMNSWADEEKAYQRLQVTLYDIERSWQYYLKHFNHGRPFILAGFSQGASAVMDILKQMPDSVRSRMVAAYSLGFKITKEDIDSAKNIKLAQGATDIGVVISFNSVKSPEGILYISEGTVACINPVNWRTDSVSTPFVLYGRRKNDTLSVRCDTVSRHLIVDGYQQKSILPVIGKFGNYHHMELKFYYPYIRQNIADRVAAFFAEKKEE